MTGLAFVAGCTILALGMVASSVVSWIANREARRAIEAVRRTTPQLELFRVIDDAGHIEPLEREEGT